jgi:hypothetical protein
VVLLKKRFYLVIIIFCLTSICYGKEIVTTKSGKQVILNDDYTWEYLNIPSNKIEFKILVNDFQRKTLPRSATSDFILRLKIFLAMSNSQIESLIKKSFPNFKISGNETIFDPREVSSAYIPGKCRFISRVTVGDNPAVGFRSIYPSLAKGLIDTLKKEKFQPYGVGQAPEGTCIFRKNGYHIMFKYNDIHDMWEFLLSKY